MSNVNSQEIIKLENVSFSYSDKKEKALDNINLSVLQGQCILFCGASGCGKSTILQLINGVIPDYYNGTLEGNIFIESENVAGFSIQQKSKSIGSVFQNPKSQFFHLNTTDEVCFAAANHLTPKEDILARLEDISISFNIKHLLDKDIFAMSGGEKQRLAIASVAMNKPNIYLLDEPSSNLDKESITKLKDILIELKSSGATIIIAEHRLYYALEVADRVIYMNGGSFIHEYSKADFVNISEQERITLGLRSIHEDNLKLQVIKQMSKDTTVIENLVVKYRDKIAVDIEKLEIPKNSIVAIVGENGAGKSSLASALCGILKSKNALIDSKKINAKVQNKEAFMVMQDVNNQLFCESVLDEIISITDESDEIVARAKDILKHLNLLEYADIHPLALSGGQKQRLVIATALFLNKRYLIFDEPTSGLDYKNMIVVSEILKYIKKSVPCLLVITHDSEFIHSCADYVLRMEHGRVVSMYTIENN